MSKPSKLQSYTPLFFLEIYFCRKGSEFLCHVKYKNNLPEVPVESKLILVPSDLSRLTCYAPTDLERDYKYSIPGNVLETPFMDMVNLDSFKPHMNEILSGEDEALLVSFDVLERKRKMTIEIRAAQESSGPSSPIKSAPVSMDTASRRPEVTWLRRTEYISSEFGKTKKNIPPRQHTSHNQRGEVRRLETKDDLIKTIENSFEQSPLESLVHPVNPNLTAIESIPIVPVLDGNIQGSFTQCLFDADPNSSFGLGDVPIASDADKMAILRAMSNPNDPSETFVWYYLRSKESPDTDTLVYVRDYDIQRNDKSGQMYILLVDEGCCRYVPVTTQFHLRKRRLKASETPRNPHSLKITRRPSH